MDIHAIEYIVFMFNLICQSWGGGYICQPKPTLKKTSRNFFLILGVGGGGGTPAK